MDQLHVAFPLCLPGYLALEEIPLAFQQGMAAIRLFRGLPADAI
jgi:hypothetical protein